MEQGDRSQNLYNSTQKSTLEGTHTITNSNRTRMVYGESTQETQRDKDNFTTLVKIVYKMIQAAHHLIKLELEPQGPRGIRKITEYLLWAIKPANITNDTQKRLETNAKNWTRHTLEILKSHYESNLEKWAKEWEEKVGTYHTEEVLNTAFGWYRKNFEKTATYATLQKVRKYIEPNWSVRDVTKRLEPNRNGHNTEKTGERSQEVTQYVTRTEQNIAGTYKLWKTQKRTQHGAILMQQNMSMGYNRHGSVLDTEHEYRTTLTIPPNHEHPNNPLCKNRRWWITTLDEGNTENTLMTSYNDRQNTQIPEKRPRLEEETRQEGMDLRKIGEKQQKKKGKNSGGGNRPMSSWKKKDNPTNLTRWGQGDNRIFPTKDNRGKGDTTTRIVNISPSIQGVTENIYVNITQDTTLTFPNCQIDKGLPTQQEKQMGGIPAGHRMGEFRAQNAGITRHPNTEQKNKDWTLSPVRPIIIIGDSNVSRIKHCPNDATQIDSFPGVKFTHVQVILEKLKPQQQVRTLILSVGINNRSQKSPTAIRQLQLLLKTAQIKFPNARILPVALNYSRELPREEELTILGINKFMKTQDHIPTLSNKLFRVGCDNIHWTEATAQHMISKWMKALN